LIDPAKEGWGERRVPAAGGAPFLGFHRGRKRPEMSAILDRMLAER